MTATPFTQAEAIELLDTAIANRSAMTAELTRMNFGAGLIARVANADPMDWIKRTDRQKITDLADGKPILYGDYPEEFHHMNNDLSDNAVRDFLAESSSPSDSLVRNYQKSEK